MYQDCGAWDSRAYEAERAAAMARGHDFQRWHDDNDSHVKAWRKSAPYEARPFRFEDLNGKPDPAKWGPKYTKPVKRKSAFNDETNIPTNCA